jgi:hypothetical protein
MYLAINVIHAGGVIEAFEQFEDDFVVGYVAPDGSPVDLAALEDVRVVYRDRAELTALPAI